MYNKITNNLLNEFLNLFISYICGRCDQSSFNHEEIPEWATKYKHHLGRIHSLITSHKDL